MQLKTLTLALAQRSALSLNSWRSSSEQSALNFSALVIVVCWSVCDSESAHLAAIALHSVDSLHTSY